MKAILAVALVMTSAPALAAGASEDENAGSRNQRRYCTRVELTSDHIINRSG